MLAGPSRNKFSIRQMLLVTFLLALFSFLIAAAYAGEPMAYGLVLATFGLVVPICCIVFITASANFIAQCNLGWSRNAKERADGNKAHPSDVHDSATQNNSGRNGLNSVARTEMNE